MAPRIRALAAAFSLSLAVAVPAAEPDIPFERFVLPNGLTVIVHEDHKAPIVAVNIWYHIGGKDEPSDRTEFAHLFEHLMFQGSEHYNDEFFKPFELVGATEQNGTTDSDRTNYFQNVPTTALDMALWMESDRMGHLLGVVDQARLDEQRGVVRNEKRQRENQPYGLAYDQLIAGSYPPGHPYHDDAIAPDDLLKDANLEDVKEWFRDHYGAANATLVLAGDIDVATAKEKAQKYFGHIPAGPPQTRHQVWIAERTESSRDVMYDRVAQARVMRAWNVPQTGSRESDLLGVASQVLGGSAVSRLDERLVYRDQLVDGISAFNYAQEISGLFIIDALVKNGVDPKRVEAAIDEEIARLVEDGPTAAEIGRAQTAVRAGFVRGIERIGGFGGKADALAECQVYAGDPGCFRASLATIAAATPAQVRDVLARWLERGDHTLTILPYPDFAPAAADAVDRKAGPPKVDRFPDLSFPPLQRATLKNGVSIVLAERHETPVVQLQYLFDAGYSADGPDGMGTAGFTMGMLDEGAGKYEVLAFKARAEELGAQLGAGSGVDYSDASLSALTDRLDESLALFSDLVRRPRFEAADIERVRKQWLAAIAQEKTSPQGIALRLMPPLLFGTGHPYAMPFSGTGTEASIAALTRDDLVAFHRDWVRPDNATLLIVGDTTLAQIVPLLEKHFGDWKAPAGTKPAKRVEAVARPAAPRVFLVDKPGAEQSTIIAGHVTPSARAANYLEMDTANSVLGGLFSARLNTNLREARHWSYGTYSYLVGALVQRLFLVSAPVQTDKTIESIGEVRREIAEFVGDKPATAEEIAKVKDNDIRQLPGQFETSAAVRGSLQQIVTLGRPDDAVQTLRARLAAQTDDGVRAAAREIIQPAALTWVIVGDLSKIEQPIRDLGLGAVKVMDADGKILR
jgi:predicted Zn-dependent peptidase